MHAAPPPPPPSASCAQCSRSSMKSGTSWHLIEPDRERRRHRRRHRALLPHGMRPRCSVCSHAVVRGLCAGSEHAMCRRTSHAKRYVHRLRVHGLKGPTATPPTFGRKLLACSEPLRSRCTPLDGGRVHGLKMPYSHCSQIQPEAPCMQPAICRGAHPSTVDVSIGGPSPALAPSRRSLAPDQGSASRSTPIALALV